MEESWYVFNAKLTNKQQWKEGIESQHSNERNHHCCFNEISNIFTGYLDNISCYLSENCDRTIGSFENVIEGDTPFSFPDIEEDQVVEAIIGSGKSYGIYAWH